MAKNTYATLAQQIQIKELLEQRLDIEKDRGTCRYINPKDNDHILAAEISPELNGNHVARVRKELFGNLSEYPRSGRTSLLEVETRFNLLIDQLRSSGISGIEHLKFKR